MSAIAGLPACLGAYLSYWQDRCLLLLVTLTTDVCMTMYTANESRVIILRSAPRYHTVYTSSLWRHFRWSRYSATGVPAREIDEGNESYSMLQDKLYTTCHATPAYPDLDPCHSYPWPLLPTCRDVALRAAPLHRCIRPWGSRVPRCPSDQDIALLPGVLLVDHLAWRHADRIYVRRASLNDPHILAIEATTDITDDERTVLQRNASKSALCRPKSKV